MALIRNAIICPEGQRIAYAESSGKRGPCIVCVHGSCTSALTFIRQLEGPLGRKYRIIALDLPGHGSSPAATEPQTAYTIAGFAEVISAFASKLRLEDAVYVGWSFGGNILLEATEALGARGLMIIGTPPLSTPADLAQALIPHAVSPLFGKETLSADDVDALGGLFMLDSELLGLIKKEIAISDGLTRPLLLNSIVEGRFADARATINSMSIPLALAIGRHDPLISRNYLEELRPPTLWRGKVHVIDEAAHAPQLEQPEAFDILLDEFMREL